MEDERFKSLSRMLRYELKSTMKIEDVIPKLPSYIIGIEKTGDIYLDFSYYCAIVIIDNTPKVQEGMITAIGVIRRLLEIVISWGIYPHLPKSLHIPFLDDPHWLMTPAPPRMLRPKPEMLQALEIFITSPGVQLIHPLFLHHCICIFYYLEPARLNLIIQDQPTENVISCLIALFQTGLEFGPLLISVIQERTDSFEAIERTKFPIKLCARAISVPPKNVSNDEYFDKLFPRLITAINSGKGSDLSKEIISEIINHNINEFFKHFDMHLLLEWPTYKSISPIIFQLDNIIYDDDIPKVLITPIPQRLLFIASNENVNETIREKIISLLKKYFKDEKSSIELIKSIIEVETLSPLGIDHINLLTNENGIFVVENDNDDDFDALENMRNLIVDKIIVNENQIKDFIDWFPPTMSSIDFVSKILMKYKEIDNDLASSLLFFEEFARKDLEVLIECVERMRTGELDQVAYQNAEDCYQTLWEICPMLM
ncbi:hypothetical protein GPJ56_003305 [Histomonas meleagridis]|uniref:uncharacterized protein n=1 Tax=Histomonas meleagridis TaxID=135588 RepID=UPI0035596EB9|nr:hypothetical protein GPJ56_003305 [Histomonas meleagridis]KAH0804924.1 hypothetical protein GO595_001869 [Histomonas meleagridis]